MLFTNSKCNAKLDASVFLDNHSKKEKTIKVKLKPIVISLNEIIKLKNLFKGTKGRDKYMLIYIYMLKIYIVDMPTLVLRGPPLDSKCKLLIKDHIPKKKKCN